MGRCVLSGFIVALPLAGLGVLNTVATELQPGSTPDAPVFEVDPAWRFLRRGGSVTFPASLSTPRTTCGCCTAHALLFQTPGRRLPRQCWNSIRPGCSYRRGVALQLGRDRGRETSGP